MTVHSQPKLTNMQSVSGLKDTTLVDGKLLKSMSQLTGLKSDISEQKAASAYVQNLNANCDNDSKVDSNVPKSLIHIATSSALNLAKSEQKSSIHAIQPAKKSLQALQERMRESEQADQKNQPNFDIKLEVSNWKATKQNFEALTTNVHMGKIDPKRVLGANVSGLPGNQSVLNSNENSSNAPHDSKYRDRDSSNSGHNANNASYKFPLKKHAEAQMKLNQVLKAQKSNQRVKVNENSTRTVIEGSGLPRNISGFLKSAADSQQQMNQQITINNNISITTIHNHDQGDKIIKKQQFGASNLSSGPSHGKVDERQTRVSRSANLLASNAAGDPGPSDEAETAGHHQNSLSNLKLQDVFSNLGID